MQSAQANILFGSSAVQEKVKYLHVSGATKVVRIITKENLPFANESDSEKFIRGGKTRFANSHRVCRGVFLLMAFAYLIWNLPSSLCLVTPSSSRRTAPA
jgi:hypothetical protein